MHTRINIFLVKNNYDIAIICKKMNKLPVDRKRTIITFIIADIAFAGLLFLSCIHLFLFTPFGPYQLFVIGAFVIVSLIMLALSLTRNFYVLENKQIVVVRAYKEMFYQYDDVVYIDKEKSEKKKTVCFFTNKGHTRYLPFDKDGKIYKEMVKKCHNVISEEEFKSRYPQVKL